LRSWSNDEIDDGVAHGRLGGGPLIPPRMCEAAVQECASDHGHKGMTMEALPGSSFEVIEPEFLFQLLVGLFANPSRFDRGS
jgi:hypothetical protein